MSFARYKDRIENGDCVMLYLGFENMHAITIKKGTTFQTRYGAVKHSDLIGVRYGSRFNCKNGYLYVLYPTPELWTSNLPHRTQILYATDISMITLQLDLRPGSVVVESGTGSGSLSHSIIRTIAPTGHLHTFEFHEQRAQTAADEFKAHGLEENVTVTQRDVCQDGFQLDHVADAIFLDLPKPWEAIASGKQALKHSGGRLCSFSPCIEQVQRTCSTLTQHGFCELNTVECLLRNFDVRTINLPLANLGPDSPCDQSHHGNHAAEQDKKHRKCEDAGGNTEAACGDMVVHDSTETQAAQPNSQAGHSSKKQKTENTRHDFDLIGFKDGKSFFFKTAASQVQMPGHTGFLTFATLYPV